MPDKAIFLDCDGTLIEDPGYINDPDQVKLLDGVPEALIEFGAMGYKLIVVSNQSAVARGIVTEKILGEIHNRLKQLLAEKGASLDRIYYCPYHPDGVIARYRKESNLRKPNPGMLLTAADEVDIDLARSWVIGDSSRDIEAGLRAGCKTILINRSSRTNKFKPGEPKPDYRAINIKEAVNIIKKHHRSSGGYTPETRRPAKPRSQPVSQTVEKPEQPSGLDVNENSSGERTEQLLAEILEQLKRTRRADMFNEFSIMRMPAGIFQIIALFCLLISIWFLMSPTRQDNSVLIALGFAMVFQMMSLTFYIMEGRK